MYKDRIKHIILSLVEALNKQRKAILAMSCLVVFVTTYVLILPAFTLEKDTAAEQGGIDVPSVESTETVVDDDAPGEDAQALTESGGDEESSGQSKTAGDPITCEGDGFALTVEDTAKVLPEDTAVVATELLEKPAEGTNAERKEAAEAYKNYYDKALAAVNDETGSSKSISFVRFYDITLQSEGEVIQPEKPVNVTIAYDKEQRKDLEVDKKQDVHIIHFAEDDKTGEITAEILDDKNVDVTLEQKKMAETTFKAESFSVYGVMYTVDFEYQNNGGNDPKTSYFSDENLVKVSPKEEENDWMLDSLQAFKQTQSSSDLAQFLTNAAINAPVNSDGKYVITPDTSYSMSLTFGETKTLQFSEGALTYDLSQSGLDFSGLAQQATFTLKVNDGGTFYDITGNQFSIDENGILTINFNSSDPNYSKLTASNNLKYTINLSVKVNSDANKIVFTDEIQKEVVIDTSNSVSASKSATFNKNTNKIDYTVAVVSHGVSQNVVVKDTITGDVLSLDASSISATSSTGRIVTMNGGASGNSFEYTIPTMSNGEVITFTYSADVDLSQIHNNNGKYVASGSNRVEVKSDGDPEPDVVSRTTTIDYTPTVTKSNGTITEDNGNKKTLSWTITANEDCKVSMAGGTITDTISSNSQDIMKYSGTGIKVQVYDANGALVRTDDPVSWNDMESKSDSSWTYRIPASDAGHAYKYVITYTTEVDVTGKTGATQVENTVHTDGGKSSTGHGNVPTPPGNEVKLEKSVGDIDMKNREVTWNISFNVPAEGLNTAVVTEVYPNQWASNVQVIDDYVDGSLSVSGLKSGEHYEAEHHINTTGNIYNKAMGSVITFYKNATETGLQSGEPRTITITLKTKINETWLEAARSTDWLKTHTNNVKLLANTDTKEAQAPAIIAAENIQKKSEFAGVRVENGVEYPVYKYTVRLDNVTSDVNVITDTYDTSLLMPYEGDHAFYLGYGNEYTAYGGWYSSAPASYVETSTGMTITTADESIPKHEDGSYYPAYWLYYYLTVKDEAALKTIMGEAAGREDHIFTMKNTAKWNNISDGADVTYEYRGVEKELLTSANDLKVTDEDIWADYRITLNPGALTLNGGDPITVTDAITNLSIDYESIEVTPEDGVSWDQSSSVTTFTIPDATKIVITYRARVLFTTIGEAGDTINVNFSNKVTMDTYEDSVGGTGERHNSGSGGASVPVINALKYRAGNMNQPLAGAEFVLLDANKVPVTWGKDYGTHKVGDPVQFVTDSDGKIQVRGDQENYGWALNEEEKYYLREIKAPDGYMLAIHDWEFTISADGTTDYTGSYKYHTGDTMSVRNYPGTDVKVRKVWSDGNDNHASDKVTVKLQQKIGTADWSDTVYIDKNGSNSNESVWEGSEKTYVLCNENNWEGTFAGLPLVAPQDPSDPLSEDVDVTYRVIETLVNGEAPAEGTFSIEQSKDGGAYVFVINNTVEEQTGSLKITKSVKINNQSPEEAVGDSKGLADGTYSFQIWNADGSEPATKADGTAFESLTITVTNGVVSPAGGLTVDGLAAGDYVIKESASHGNNGNVMLDPNSTGYDAVKGGIPVTVIAGKTGDAVDVPTAVFTNKYETTEASVTKVWSDNNSTERPSSLEVALVKDGVLTDQTVTLTSSDNWAAKTIDNLPKYQNGVEIDYTWQEAAVPAGYFLTDVARNGTVTTLTNTLQEYDLKTSYIGTKIWSDEGDKYSTRPDELAVTLYKNGVPTNLTPTWVKDTVTDQWTYTFSDLPVFDENGDIIQYYAEEGIVGGYTSSKETTATSYQIGQIHPDSKVIKNHPDNQLEWSFYSLTDLPFLIVKQGHNYLIWTQRAATPAEQAVIDNWAQNNSFYSDHVTHVFGIGDVAIGNKGTINIGYVKTENGYKVTITFHDPSQWSQFAQGAIAVTSENDAYFSGTTTFTNSLETTDLSGSKVWEITGDEIPEDPILTLKRTVTTSDVEGEAVTSAPEIVTAKDSTDKLQPVWSGEGMTRSFTYSGLPKKDNNGNEYTYSVEEYQFTVGDVTYTISKGNDGSFTAAPDTAHADSAVPFKVTQVGNTITNAENNKTSITIVKIEKGTDITKTLTGAKFTLTEVISKDNHNNKEGGIQKPEEEVNENGQIIFDDLTAGVYKLEETQNPVGYVATEGPYFIEVKNGSSGMTSEIVGAYTMITKDPNTDDTFYVQNEPGAVLPSAGGIGTTLFYILGSMLAVGCGVILVSRRRIRRDGENL